MKIVPGLWRIAAVHPEWERVIVHTAGGCAAIVRTCWWHERSTDAARTRYGCEVWAREPSPGAPAVHVDRPVGAAARLPGGLQVFSVVRDDELAVWLPDQRALVFGDVMVRSDAGALSMCPESWVTRTGGHPALRGSLERLLVHDAEHVLVSHGPLVLGGGHDALARAIR
jgi:hypothetical protein